MVTMPLEQFVLIGTTFFDKANRSGWIRRICYCTNASVNLPLMMRTIAKHNYGNSPTASTREYAVRALNYEVMQMTVG